MSNLLDKFLKIVLPKRKAEAVIVHPPAPAVIQPPPAPVKLTVVEPLPPIFSEINWEDPDAKISKHFTVKQALLLPRWGVMHRPSAEEQLHILDQAERMDKVQEMLGVEHKIKVHCWIRPKVANCPGSKYNGQNYNALVKGAPRSAHIKGQAVDFSVPSFGSCDAVRSHILPGLTAIPLRLELNPGSNWVHLDAYPGPHFRV
jgi:hypothetical protein